MSGILWQEMLRQGAVKSRTEAERLVRQGAVDFKVMDRWEVADHPALDLPGMTQVKVGKHRFISIPCTPPENAQGELVIPLRDVLATAEELKESGSP